MTRIQLACCCLLASAFVLGGVLLVKLGTDLEPVAHADMVVTRDNFTFMTALTADGAESVFLLDNLNEKLLIYDPDIARKEIRLGQVLPLAPGGGGASGGAGRGPR